MQKVFLQLLFSTFLLNCGITLEAQQSKITFGADACKPLVFSSFSGDCSAEQIWLMSSATTDCAAAKDLFWDWEMDYFGDGTIDQKGKGSIVTLGKTQFLANGKHLMKWIVTDHCGTSATCTQSIQIRDAVKPTPVAKLLSLGDWTQDCKIIIEAQKLNNFSWDNCTPMSELKFKVAKMKQLPQNIDLQYVLGLDDRIELSASDIGQTEVAFFAIDKDLNFAYTNTIIIITQPCHLIKTKKYLTCIDVETYYNKPITDLKFLYQNTVIKDVDMVNPGIYCFPYHGINAISIVKEDALANGLTGLDYLILNKHILGIEALNSNQQLLADYNRDKRISTADLVSIRKEIFGVESTSPTWFFAKQNVQLWDTLADEEYKVKGYRIGDMTGNANPTGNTSLKEQAIGNLNFVTEDILMLPNKTYTVYFKLNAKEGMQGFQNAIRPLNGTLTILDASTTNGFSGVSTALLNDGSVRILEITPVNQKTLIFNLKLKSSKLQYLSEAITNEDPNLFSEAYTAKNEIYDTHLKFIRKEVDPYTEKAEIVGLPNPFTNTTTLRFQAQESGIADVLIYNQLGQLVHNDKLQVYAGLNEYEYQHHSNNNEVLYCKIVTKEEIKVTTLLFQK